MFASVYFVEVNESIKNEMKIKKNNQFSWGNTLRHKYINIKTINNKNTTWKSLLLSWDIRDDKK